MYMWKKNHIRPIHDTESQFILKKKILGKSAQKIMIWPVINKLIYKSLDLYQTTNVTFSQTERVCVQQFKLTKGSHNRVENALGEGEIARHKQFHLFQQCFQKICYANT